MARVGDETVTGSEQTLDVKVKRMAAKGLMNYQAKLEKLNQKIVALTVQRNAALRELRTKCEHTRLVEGTCSGSRPYRICVDCGAEEEGWYCGWHVLILANECEAPRLKMYGSNRPGGILIGGSDWCKYRKDGPIYRVGQSHANFAGGGRKTYQQLTES